MTKHSPGPWSAPWINETQGLRVFDAYGEMLALLRQASDKLAAYEAAPSLMHAIDDLLARIDGDKL